MPRRRPELLLIAAVVSLSACGQAAPSTSSAPSAGEPRASRSAEATSFPDRAAPTPLRPGLPTIQEIVRTDPRMARGKELLNSSPEPILSIIEAEPGRAFTFLVPSNEAFDALADAIVRRLAGEGENPDSFIRSVIGMHWAEDIDVHLDEMASGTDIQMAKSRVTYTMVDGVGHLDYALVLDAVPGSNGYVYLIDTVLIPPCEIDVGQKPSPTHAPCATWLQEPA
jgi:uncharacterized surface protein with fasciclin (FAS1) repeats